MVLVYIVALAVDMAKTEHMRVRLENNRENLRKTLAALEASKNDEALRLLNEQKITKLLADMFANNLGKKEKAINERILEEVTKEFEARRS